MQDTSLRRAVAGDSDAIAELTHAAYSKWVPVIGRKPIPMTVDYSVALVANRFDLMYVGTSLAGLIETVSESAGLLVENLAVHPNWQGRGLGRRLMAHGERLAIEAGMSYIRLYTNQGFDANIRLYQALGFVTTSEEVFGDGVLVHMSKQLDPVG